MKPVYCLDCGKKLSKWAYYNRSKRCHSCFNKLRWKNKNYKKKTFKKISKTRILKGVAKGNKNPNYKNHSLIGKNNPAYKDGRSLKKYRCIDCGKKVHWQTGFNGSGLCMACTRKGKRSHTWNGGKSREPYPLYFNKSLKIKILKRDNYKCQLCGCLRKFHRKYYKSDLGVHHIDYNKKNCQEWNLITLCIYCNNKVNYNRDKWVVHFRTLLHRPKIVWDLDGIICKKLKNCEDYLTYSKPNKKIIKIIQKLKEKGYWTIIYTARRMESSGHNIGRAIVRASEKTFKWLRDNKVPFDELWWGKPNTDTYYIDDKGICYDEKLTLKKLEKLVNGQ